MDFPALILKFRYPLLLLLVGLILAGFGVLLYQNSSQTKVEILESSDGQDTRQIVVEASGAFEKPGVYKLPTNSRVEDLFILAGGVSANADRIWIERSINRAAKLLDGQKIFIPDEQSNVLSASIRGVDQSGSSILGSQGSGLTNINTASKSQLEDLVGIGPVYAQNIIDHRPYSDASELVSKGAIKQGVYEKIKNKVTVY